MNRASMYTSIGAAAAIAVGALGWGTGSAQATILATEDFSGVTLTGNTPVLLSGVNDGTGWSKGWYVQNGGVQSNGPNGGTGIPGYNVANASPLAGADAGSNYATGGYQYDGSSRPFSTSLTGVFGLAGLVNSNGTIGVAGKTILMSVLLADGPSASNTLVALGNSGASALNYQAFANAGVGSYGSNHTVWNLSGGNGTSTITNVSTGLAVSSGTPVELVMEIQYTTGTAANLSMWVNPTGYSDLNPTIPVGTPNATMTSTDATFSYAFFFAAANGTGAKFTDFVVATPSSAIPEPSALGLMSLAGMGILLLGRKRKSA